MKLTQISDNTLVIGSKEHRSTMKWINENIAAKYNYPNSVIFVLITGVHIAMHFLTENKRRFVVYEPYFPEHLKPTYRQMRKEVKPNAWNKKPN